MVNRNLAHNLDAASSLSDWEDELNRALDNQDLDAGKEWRTPEEFGANRIVEGVITRVENEFVLVDIGSKSEGAIKRDEWSEDEEAPLVGQRVRAFIEDDDESEKPLGNHDWILLSKRKADRIEEQENIWKRIHEGDVVEGIVTRRIRGGLMVDIGVNAFLPASQVDIHPTLNIADYIGKSVKCVVLEIDKARRNIVVSRRALIEVERKERKRLSESQKDFTPVSSAVNTSPASPERNKDSEASSLLLLIQNWPHIVHNGWILYYACMKGSNVVGV